MADYTPATDFDFPGTAYTPGSDFDFTATSESTTYDFSFSQEWVLEVEEYAHTGAIQFTQEWALSVPFFWNWTSDMAWNFEQPVYVDAALTLSWGVTCPDFQDSDLQQAWRLECPAWQSTNLDQSWTLSCYTYHDALLLQQWALTATAIWTRVITATTYRLILTGDADEVDDVELPMARYSSRMKSGEPSYLQVSVPNARAYVDQISLRTQGDLIISRGIRWSDGSFEVEEIARATIDRIGYDIGARSSTASITGRGTTTNDTPKSVVVPGISYHAISNNKSRYRGPIVNALRPGDTAVIDGAEIVVGEVQHIVSPNQGYMEIAEA